MKYYYEIKRSTAALGTFFEIKCLSEKQDFDKTHNLITAAFSQAKFLENKLSFHNKESDLSKINQLEINKEIIICDKLVILLRISNYLNKVTDNIFNVISPHQPLIANDQFFTLKKNRIKILQKLEIDLGGIAKGFIVDKTAKFLIRNGVYGGIVNGGGDIRIFGNYSTPIHIRDPFNFKNHLAIGSYSNQAIASSSITLNSKERGGKSSIYNNTSSDIVHTTVIGKSCTICDALTKISLINPDIATKLLKNGYSGILIDKNGQVFKTI